jgi:hypothetical protein
MTVTDPGTPDPLNDPRTRQADPGALGQGEDLASAEDDPVATGDDELASGPPEDAAGAGDAGGAFPEATPAGPMTFDPVSPADLSAGEIPNGVPGT